MWKDSIFCSHCPWPPYSVLRFAYSLEKEHPRVPGIRRQHKQDWGRKCSPLRKRGWNTLSRQNGSGVAPKRYGATEETSPCDAAGISSRQFIPHPFPFSSSAPHRTALSKRTIRVVSSRRCLKVFRPPLAWKEWGNRDCSCQSSGMEGREGERETSGFGIFPTSTD